MGNDTGICAQCSLLEIFSGFAEVLLGTCGMRFLLKIFQFSCTINHDTVASSHCFCSRATVAYGSPIAFLSCNQRQRHLEPVTPVAKRHVASQPGHVLRGKSKCKLIHASPWANASSFMHLHGQTQIHSCNYMDKRKFIHAPTWTNAS
eukprot:362523-Chlamydomonas_euryale.AAC.1